MNPSITTVRERNTTTRTLGNIATIGKRKCRILPITKKRIGGNVVQPITILTAAQKAALHKALVPKTLPPVMINAKEVLGETIVGHEEGRKIYPLVKKALLQGRKTIISVKDMDVYGGFWDTAICKAYGEFTADIVDNNVEVVDATKSELISLRNMKEMRKFFYYDRDFYNELVSDRDPKLCLNEECVTDDEFIPGVDDADYNMEDE